MRLSFRPMPSWRRPVVAATELASSYVKRLARTLGATVGYLQQAARSRGMTLIEYAEAKTALHHGTLVADTRFVEELAGRRFACPECTHGELVELEPHVDFYCCLEHGIWVGPRSQPPSEGYRQHVAQFVLDADVTYRQLRREGHVTQERLALAAWVVCEPGVDGRRPARLDVANFVDVVEILRLMSDPELVGTMRAAETPNPERRALAQSRVEEHLDRPPAIVTSRLTAAMRSSDAEEQGHGERRLRHTVPRREALRAPVAGDDATPRRASSYRARLVDGSLASVAPALAAEWHPTRNGTVTPDEVTSSSNYQRFWWRCQNCGHDWMATPNNRVRGKGCPACAGRVTTPQNSLTALRPELASEWDSEINGSLTPEDVTPGSGRVVGWICPEGHRYRAAIDLRTINGTGCPVCAGLAVVPGVNDLATTHPDVADMWHPTDNGALTARRVTAGSGARVVWWCRTHQYAWTATVASRALAGRGCPVCGGQQVLPGVNDLATLRPDVAQYWVSGDPPQIDPSQVSVGSARWAVWRCTNDLPHTFRRTIAKRVQNANCPVCTNHTVLPGFNDLATRYPALAVEWHETLNGTTPDQVVPGNKPRWWRCYRGHLVQGAAPNRIATKGCPRCPPEQRSLFRY